jgi:signal transduction histidine kinase
MVMEEIRRVDDMIKSFLKYGKPLNLKRQQADVRRLLDEVLEVAAQKAQAEQIRVEREYAADLPGILVDVPHVKTCFLNLVLNAFQAMAGGGGGTLRVYAELVNGSSGPLGDLESPVDQSIIRPIDSPKAWVGIRFQDTGTGIAPEHLSHIFEPYFTTKDVGIGLGLALTKQIVEEHGGRIELTSQPGQGTLVRIRLPIGVPTA